jgi:hypothetical protein
MSTFLYPPGEARHSVDDLAALRKIAETREALAPFGLEPFVSQLNERDLEAIYAYLRTVPPIHNRVPDYMEPHEVAAMAREVAPAGRQDW